LRAAGVTTSLSKLVKSYVSITGLFPIDVGWSVGVKPDQPVKAKTSQDDSRLEDELQERLNALLQQIETIEVELSERRQTAEKEIGRMMQEAQTEFAALRQQTFEQGRTEGLIQAQAETMQAREDAIRHATEMIDAARRDVAGLLAQSEPFVVQLAMDIGKKVVMSELALSPEMIASIAREAFISIEQSCDAELRVSPDDYEWITDHRNQWEPASELSIRVIIVPDGSIERGGCLITTLSGAIDARVETRMESVRKCLREAIEERRV